VTCFCPYLENQVHLTVLTILLKKMGKKVVKKRLRQVETVAWVKHLKSHKKTAKDARLNDFNYMQLQLKIIGREK